MVSDRVGRKGRGISAGRYDRRCPVARAPGPGRDALRSHRRQLLAAPPTADPMPAAGAAFVLDGLLEHDT